MGESVAGLLDGGTLLRGFVPVVRIEINTCAEQNLTNGSNDGQHQLEYCHCDVWNLPS